MPAAAPNHVDHHQPAAAAAGASSWANSPIKASVHHHDPSVSPDRDDPTRLLVKMLAATALEMPPPPMAAPPTHVDQPQAPAPSAAEAVAGASVFSTTAGHFPAVAPPDGDGDEDDDLTISLTKSFATATLGTAAAAGVSNAAPNVSVTVTPPTRSIHQGAPTAAAKPPSSSGGGRRAERKARRRTRLHLVRVPTDYLRAGQESRDRRRRRKLVRRCVGRLFSLHEDRFSERDISAMMARLTSTALEQEHDDAAAAAPSPEEDAGLAELLEKMEVSIE